MDWNQRLSGGAIVELTAGELNVLLAAGEVVREDDTKISGTIRIVSVDGVVAVQEQTPKNVILIRALSSLQDAQRLVEERLDTYDRMWDGCGCKVDYYGRE